MSNLIGPVTPGNTHNDDAILFNRALKQRWPMSDEAKARWMARIGGIIDHGDDRQAVSAFKATLTADALNQRDEHAEEYGVTEGANVQVRILSPAETAKLMDSSIPDAEYRVVSEAARPDNSFGAGILSCPPLVPPATSPTQDV